MTTGGWTTLLISTVAVWTLAIWCYWKVLSAPPDDDISQPPDSLGG